MPRVVTRRVSSWQCQVDLTLFPQLPHLSTVFFHVGTESSEGVYTLLAAGGRYRLLVESGFTV